MRTRYDSIAELQENAEILRSQLLQSEKARLQKNV